MGLVVRWTGIKMVVYLLTYPYIRTLCTHP